MINICLKSCFLLVLVSAMVQFISVSAVTTFGNRVAQGKIDSASIDEASGMAISREHKGVLYTHNDKGDSSRFFAVDIQSGNRLATFNVKGVQNYDWEDMAIGPCADDCAQGHCTASMKPVRFCLYIAETGDHKGDGAKNMIYMVREPNVIGDGDISVVDTLHFSWTELDCETLMVAPDGRLFVVSKVHGGRARIAQLPNSAWGKNAAVALDMSKTAVLQINTDKNDPQGGDISPDGKEMVLVAEEGVYYFSVPDMDYIKAVREGPPVKLTNYVAEPSTEAIGWTTSGSGFYVLPEGNFQRIYFYPKLVDGHVVVG